MRASYSRSLAPGTQKNRDIQARVYLKFMLAYQFDCLAPSIAQLAMFTQFLCNSFPAPSTMKNYLSGAKTWVYEHGGIITSFLANEVSLLSKTLAAESQHVISQAPPLTPNDIRIICRYIDDRTLSPAIKPAILIAFAAFLRVSNVLSPSTLQWGGPHTLKFSDIVPHDGKLLIQIWSTKTKRSGPPTILEIYPSENPSSCPVLAWHRYVHKMDPYPKGPAFMYSKFKPLSPAPVVSTMRLALKQAGVKYASDVSFHSLRRGATQAAVRGGAPEQEIMSHGTWRSKGGLAAYLQTNSGPRMVPRIIAKTLAK